MSSDQTWIVVCGWDRFQHPDVTRSKQAPPWIRNYTELLHNADYLGLTLHQRGVLHGIWLEYATARRQLPGSTSAISRRLGERVTAATLEALVQAGFIAFSASKPQAERLQTASLEERRKNIAEPKRGKTQPKTKKPKPKTPTVDATDVRRKAFEAYLSHGGNLELEERRGALARNVTSLLKKGIAADIIVAAAGDLGGQGTFPGYLNQRVEEIVANGGICKNHGLTRSKLSLTELQDCGCARCADWAEALGAKT